MGQCDGCRFQGTSSKRCNVCARKYQDRFEEPKKLTAAERERAKEALFTLGLMQTIVTETFYPTKISDTNSTKIMDE